MDMRRLLPQPGRRAGRAAYTELAALASPWRPLPDYLIVGAARAGSTSLYEYLVRHPAVLPALVKEVHYFTGGYHHGVSWYRAHFPLAARRRLTALRHGAALTGEATPYYLFHPAAPMRIKALIPNVKLLAVLRDPVQRALSHYQHERRLGVESLSFEAAIDAEGDRIGSGEVSDLGRLDDDPDYAFRHQNFAYLARGRYAEQLERFLEYFPPSQLMVIRSEDLFAQPTVVYRQATDFLDLAPRPLLDYPQFNASRGMLLDPPTERRLRDYFAPHNERLENLLGRSMGW